MRALRFAVTLVVVALLMSVGAGCKKDSSNPYGAPSSPVSPTPVNVPPNTVLMSGMEFIPATITVSVGTTVTWTNDDAFAHTSTSSTGLWDSGNVAGGGSTTFKFNAPGTYQYQCTIHAAMGMRGTVIVQ